MSEKIKKIDDENIEEVTGGRGYQILKQKIQSIIPIELKEKLNTAKSDMEACKLLAENGIDVEKIEKMIADSGFDQIRIGMQLPDDSLTGIAGGFQEGRLGEVKCTCGNSNRDNFSRQFWASLASRRFTSIYRCICCDKYVGVLASGGLEYMSGDELTSKL